LTVVVVVVVVVRDLGDEEDGVSAFEVTSVEANGSNSEMSTVGLVEVVKLGGMRFLLGEVDSVE
jgi:hypothetical protein